MGSPSNDTRISEALGVLTPDSRRWRFAASGVAATASVVLFYQTVSLISSTWSGTLPSLLVGVGVVLTLLSAAAVPTVLLAPDRTATARRDSETEGDAVETLKRRYAAGDISEEEFERRIDTLLGVSAGIGDGTIVGSAQDTRENEQTTRN